MTENLNNVLRVHIWVTGRVQGVGFRAFVLDSGTQLGLTGWVRNVGYHQVEALAEGSHATIERFIDAVKSGPSLARVEESRVEYETPTGEFKYFSVNG